MNGVHDMGGMHGFGPVKPEPNEPVFHSDWERRVFAMHRAMGYAGPGISTFPASRETAAAASSIWRARTTRDGRSACNSYWSTVALSVPTSWQPAGAAAGQGRVARKLTPEVITRGLSRGCF